MKSRKKEPAPKTNYFAGPPLRFSTPEELEEKILEYFETCESEKRPFTKAGLAAFLGIHPGTLVDYEAGRHDHRAPHNPFSKIVRRASGCIEAHKLEYALQGRYQAAVAIFDLKNNHGYRDAKQLEHSGRVEHTLRLEDNDVDFARRVAWMLENAAEKRHTITGKKVPALIEGETT